MKRPRTCHKREAQPHHKCSCACVCVWAWAWAWACACACACCWGLAADRGADTDLVGVLFAQVERHVTRDACR
eukprot:2983499-Prymnesium_polylepis.1